MEVEVLEKFNKEFFYEACCIIRFLRKFYSEKKLAAELGVSPSTISRCSKGKQTLPMQVFHKVYNLAKNIFKLNFLDKFEDILLNTNSDFLCTMAIITIIDILKNNVSFESILVFQEQSLIIGYIISKYLKADMVVISTSPFIPSITLQCTPVQLAEGLTTTICLKKPSKRKLHRPDAILLMPLAVKDLEIAKKIVRAIMYSYDVVAVIFPLCYKAGNVSKDIRVLCVAESNDRGFKG
jgi:transcriptional regulator with XRE-family HTH domain